MGERGIGLRRHPDRVLTLFAAYFDTHNYIGDEEYNRFEGILKKIREEME